MNAIDNHNRKTPITRKFEKCDQTIIRIHTMSDKRVILQLTEEPTTNKE